MKKSPLKEIMMELLKEAPAQAPTASSVFQKAPFGEPYVDWNAKLTPSQLNSFVDSYVKKDKVPSNYAEILKRFPSVFEWKRRGDLVIDGWLYALGEVFGIIANMTSSNLKVLTKFERSVFVDSESLRKKLFPKDWKKMSAINSANKLKSFKFTGGIDYEVLIKYAVSMYKHFDKTLGDENDEDQVTFPEFKQDFKIPDEPNTPEENKLGDALRTWFGASNNDSANTFKKYYPAIQQAKTKFPKVFSPGKEKEPVYRGTGISAAVKNILKKSNRSEWLEVNDAGIKFMVYRNPVTYTPKRVAQSWTADPSSAMQFNRLFVLITGISDQFFLNPRSSAALGSYEYNNEEEIIHVGGKFKYPVYIAVDRDEWDDWMDTGDSGDFKKVASSLLKTKTVAKKPVKNAVKKVAKKPVKKAVKKTTKKK